VAACVVVALATRSFAWGARVGVFGFPLAQLLFDTPNRVAATGALMSIIGLRFLLAARTQEASR
jgi:glycerol-3-phosphate acyltransferase PlsY